jgi:hypothetical protein
MRFRELMGLVPRRCVGARNWPLAVAGCDRGRRTSLWGGCGVGFDQDPARWMSEQ